MSFLPSLGSKVTLLDVFKKFPATALPLPEYHEILMRRPSPLELADRELIAAYVSRLNACQYCHGVHAVTATHFGVPEGLFKKPFENLAKAPIDARMRSLLEFVKKLTHTPNRICEEDAERVFAAEWNEHARYGSGHAAGYLENCRSWSGSDPYVGQYLLGRHFILPDRGRRHPGKGWQP